MNRHYWRQGNESVQAGQFLGCEPDDDSRHPLRTLQTTATETQGPFTPLPSWFESAKALSFISLDKSLLSKYLEMDPPSCQHSLYGHLKASREIRCYKTKCR